MHSGSMATESSEQAANSSIKYEISNLPRLAVGTLPAYRGTCEYEDSAAQGHGVREMTRPCREKLQQACGGSVMYVAPSANEALCLSRQHNRGNNCLGPREKMDAANHKRQSGLHDIAQKGLVASLVLYKYCPVNATSLIYRAEAREHGAI